MIDDLVEYEVTMATKSLQSRILSLEKDLQEAEMELDDAKNEETEVEYEPLVWTGRQLKFVPSDGGRISLYDLQKLAVLDVLFERMTLEQLESIQKFARAGE